MRELDAQSGVTKSPSTYTRNADAGYNANTYVDKRTREPAGTETANYGDRGGASRFFAQFPGKPPEPDAGPGFFYAPKAPTSERWGLVKCKANGHRVSDPAPVASLRAIAEGGECDECGDGLRVESHPTQKPAQTLMRYLVKLVTPPGGTLLDPFAGSGSTLVAAVEEGFGCVGIEQSDEYAEIARRRVEFAQLPEWEKAERERATKIQRRAALADPSEEAKAEREWAAMYRAEVFGETDESQRRLF